MPDNTEPGGTPGAADDQPHLAGLCRAVRCATPVIRYPPDGERPTPFWDHAETPRANFAHRVRPRAGSVAPADVWDCDDALAGRLGHIRRPWPELTRRTRVSGLATASGRTTATTATKPR